MQRICILVLCGLIAGFLSVAEAGNDLSATQRLEEALVDLRAIDQAWRENDAEFRAMRKRGTAPEVEIREFAEFVAGLQRQVFEGCQAVRELGGDPRRHGIECAILEDKSASNSAGSLKQATETLTEQEEAILLMAELRMLEGDFDGMILREQKELRERRQGGLRGGRGSGTGSGGLGSGEPGSGEPGSGESGSGEPGETPGAGAGTGTDTRRGELAKKGSEGVSGAAGGTGTKGRGAGPGVKRGGEGAGGSVPEDVGTGSDDDIVARQLREAAETESDPVLKEQLWAEYRKYKASTR